MFTFCLDANYTHVYLIAFETWFPRKRSFRRNSVIHDFRLVSSHRTSVTLLLPRVCDRDVDLDHRHIGRKSENKRERQVDFERNIYRIVKTQAKKMGRYLPRRYRSFGCVFQRVHWNESFAIIRRHKGVCFTVWYALAVG